MIEHLTPFNANFLKELWGEIIYPCRVNFLQLPSSDMFSGAVSLFMEPSMV